MSIPQTDPGHSYPETLLLAEDVSRLHLASVSEKRGIFTASSVRQQLQCVRLFAPSMIAASFTPAGRSRHIVPHRRIPDPLSVNRHRCVGLDIGPS